MKYNQYLNQITNLIMSKYKGQERFKKYVGINFESIKDDIQNKRLFKRTIKDLFNSNVKLYDASEILYDRYDILVNGCASVM